MMMQGGPVMMMVGLLHRAEVRPAPVSQFPGGSYRDVCRYMMHPDEAQLAYNNV